MSRVVVRKGVYVETVDDMYVEAYEKGKTHAVVDTSQYASLARYTHMRSVTSKMDSTNFCFDQFPKQLVTTSFHGYECGRGLVIRVPAVTSLCRDS